MGQPGRQTVIAALGSAGSPFVSETTRGDNAFADRTIHSCSQERCVMAINSRLGPISCRWILRGILFVSVLLSWATSGTQARFISPSVAAASSDAAQDRLDVRLLEPGRPIERELAGGQSHSYQLTLAADKYLLVV